MLSAGTDGNDGPINAAGDIVDSTTTEIALQLNLNIDKYLQEFNSFHFFQKVGGHIITGPTMTNVMDVMVVVVE